MAGSALGLIRVVSNGEMVRMEREQQDAAEAARVKAKEDEQKTAGAAVAGAGEAAHR